MSNTDDQRAAFEAWITTDPHAQSIERFPESGAWPNSYKVYQVHLAFDAWQAAIEHAKKTMCTRPPVDKPLDLFSQ